MKALICGLLLLAGSVCAEQKMITIDIDEDGDGNLSSLQAYLKEHWKVVDSVAITTSRRISQADWTYHVLVSTSKIIYIIEKN